MTDNFEYPSGILIPGTKYKVIRRLGAGGMGTVYEVEDTNIEKRYVLKTLHASLSSRADLAERMRREARALARLEHRNIVQVITADVTADSLRLTYLVMEKLNGHMLRTVLDNKTRLNVDTACRLSIDLLNALYHAHENRIIHRDVKPENIFLHRDADGTTVTKLLDFGIMTESDPETHAQTGHNRFIGTLRYAAPEQLSGRPITPQTDIYAAGLCLYEIITGYGPFDDLTSTAEIAHAHLHAIPPPIAKHVRVPRQLEDIVRRALSKDPADRQHDAFTFAAELNRFRKSQQGSIDLAPLSQVETVNDPFYLSTDPGAQQRLAASGGLSRPSGGGSPPPGVPMPIGGGPFASPAVQGAHALQVQPAFHSPETGGSGVRQSGEGGVDPMAYASEPGRRPALADAATEFDEGEVAGQFSQSSSGLHRGLVPMVRSPETHENASAPPMTRNGPTPVPAAAVAMRAQAPAGGQGVDRSAPTATYAPPGVPSNLRTGTVMLSGAEGSHPGPSPEEIAATQMAVDGAPATQTLARPTADGGARGYDSLGHAQASYAGPPPAGVGTSKRGVSPVVWIVVAGSAIGAMLAIGAIYHVSTRNKPPATTASASAPAVVAPPPAPEPAAPQVTAAVQAPEPASAAPADAGASPSSSGSAEAAKTAAEKPAPAQEERRHRPREQRPAPSSSTRKLPGSGL